MYTLKAGISYSPTSLMPTCTLLPLIAEPQANLSLAEETLKPGREKKMVQVGTTRTGSLIPSPGRTCAMRPHFPWLVQKLSCLKSHPQVLDAQILQLCLAELLESHHFSLYIQQTTPFCLKLKQADTSWIVFLSIASHKGSNLTRMRVESNSCVIQNHPVPGPGLMQ